MPKAYPPLWRGVPFSVARVSPRHQHLRSWPRMNLVYSIRVGLGSHTIRTGHIRRRDEPGRRWSL
jgi:hypothetical protein